MNRLLPFSAIALITALVFVACDDDDDGTSTAPKFDQIVLTPSTCNPGDSITATVTIAEEGNYYYYSYQEYTIGNSTYRLGSNSYNNSNPNRTNGSISALTGNATFTFKAPSQKSDTTYAITFHATCASSANGFEGGGLYTNTNTVRTTLTIK